MPDNQLTLNDRLAVCQQIAKLVRARLPISGELSKAVEHASSRVASSATTIDRKVSQGQSLASAIAGDGSRDSTILAACITAGERSHALDRTLQIWSDMHIANSKAAKTMRVALLYPCLLILITLFALGFVIWHLIPEYRETYVLFDQEMPGWLEAIVWARERFGPLLILLLVLLAGPLAFWLWRRRGFRADGLPKDASRRLRIQALSSEIAAIMLNAKIPLNQIAETSSLASGGNQEMAQSAFAQLQQQRPISPMAPEASMILSSVHAGLMDSSDAVLNLNHVASHLRQSAEITASRNARWIPMLVALSVGFLIVSTYVSLIYLPWIWLLRQIVTP